MTMFTLPNFCRVCLKYDKNLIDLAHIENEPSETLMSKLQHCVSEVEWTTFKPLLCHPCIKRLNIAYSFKKQCVQSAGVLKNYVELVKESQKKTESQNPLKTENAVPAGGAYMLLPNQKYVKILVGSQNQGTTGNTFQNVFLNLIPTTSLSPLSTTNSVTPQKNKDTNQNVFLNLNSTFQKFIPLTPIETAKKANSVSPKKADSAKTVNVNVNQLLTESKAEEMSVEIDPTSFLQLEQDEGSNDDKEIKDWDEVITQSKIDSKESKMNGDKTMNGNDSQAFGGYVPILPKPDDFFSSGQHFLSSPFESSEIGCESCQKTFPTIRLLKQHIKQFHLGKWPFKCEYCYTEYATRVDYDLCIKTHKLESDALNNTSLTLKDFTSSSPHPADALSVTLSELPADHNLFPNEDGDYVCNVCSRIFNSSSGLLRHKVRKHNQKNRKKYFIKGMKNARCDICHRDFSTQSYMQLHRKLHLRDDTGYKYKVLGRSKYSDIEPLNDEKIKEDLDKSPNIDGDAMDTQENEEESDSNDDEEESNCKKRKLNSEKGNEDCSDSPDESDNSTGEKDSEYVISEKKQPDDSDNGTKELSIDKKLIIESEDSSEDENRDEQVSEEN